MSLAEGPPDLPYPKLPFWDTVSLSYSTYFRHFIDALRASWLWLIVAAVVTGFASWQQWSWMATMLANLKPGLLLELSRPSEMTLLLNLDNILLLFAGVSIAVAWHRLMILNEQPGFSGGNVATKNLWRYIVVALALLLVMFLPMAAVMLPTFYILQPIPGPAPPPPAFFLLLPLGFAAYAVGSAVAFRLNFSAPGTGDRRHRPDLQADMESHPRKCLAAVLGDRGNDDAGLADCADCLFARSWSSSSIDRRQ